MTVNNPDESKSYSIMKKIQAIELPGAKKLTPMEMNKIYFETGRHTPLSDSTTSATSVASAPAKGN